MPPLHCPLRRRTIALVLLVAGALLAAPLVLLPPAPPVAEGMAEVPLPPLPDTKPRRGPDLERWYFDEWHEPYGNVLPADVLRSIWDDIEAMPSEESFPGRGLNTWDMRGPDGMTLTGGRKYSGRVVDVEASDEGGLRLGAASGGLWTYFLTLPVPLSDELSCQAIGSFATDPNDPAHIFLGTGEPYIRAGTGLYETTDGGTTWKHVDLPYAEPAGFFKIRFHPTDSNVVHVASTDGYFRTLNGGATWVQIKPGWNTDIAISQSNPDIVFRARIPFGLYRSTDGGTNWTWLNASDPTLPQDDIGRMSVAIAPSNPNVVWAAFTNASDHKTAGIYRSLDGGNSWSDRGPGAEVHWGQGYYNNCISISPTDPLTVLVGGGFLWRTTNMGLTWNYIPDSQLHVDQHAIAWHADGQRIWVGNDGGWSYSSDAGVTWSSSLNTLPVTQFYHLTAGVDDDLVLGGGTQDNGIPITTNAGASWHHRHGGDGSGVAIDPGNANNIWMVNGVWNSPLSFWRHRSTDKGQSWTVVNAGIDSSDAWLPEIRHDGVSPVWLYTNSDGWVYQSTNLGGLWSKLNTTPFEPVVTSLAVPKWAGTSILYAVLGSDVRGNRVWLREGTTWSERSEQIPDQRRIRKIAVHPTSTSVAYALIDGLYAGEKVYRTTNRGLTWTNLTANLPNVPVGDLVAHPTNSDALYLGTGMGCFRTTDGGTSWHRWNDGMPPATIVTEMTWIDRQAVDGTFWVVAGTYGRSVWRREVSGDDASNPLDAGGPERTGFRVELAQNAPNPASGRTTIRFTLPESGRAELVVYDVAGRRVETLVDGELAAGPHARELDASRLAPGAYFYRLRSSSHELSRKLLIVR